MTKKISFLIGLKNNLEYTIFFYENVRKLYPVSEIAFVSFGSTDGTHQWLDSLNDQNLKYYYSDERKTLSDTYNKATEISTGEYVCFLHNDMVLGKLFLENLSEDLSENDINFYKVVEPPVFTGDSRDWKETQDFGNDIESFDFQGFFDFEEMYIEAQGDQINETQHSSFFLCVKRETLIKIGGLDNLFNPMFCEDDDLIIRLRLLGLKTIQLRKALVYHFVSKTSRFSKEYENKTRLIEQKSQKNFIRKWGFKSGSDLIAKYDVGIILKNASSESLSKLEPFADILYVNFPYNDYIFNEQENTKYDLNKRIKPISELKNHEVMIHVNGKAINEKTISLIENIPQIVSENKSKYINPTFLYKLFLKIIKPYRPLVYFKNAQRKEKSLIFIKD